MIDLIFGVILIVVSFFMMIVRNKKIDKLIYRFEGLYLLILFLLFILGVVMLLDGVVAS